MVDNFNDNDTDTDLWNKFSWTGDILVEETGGQLQIVLPDNLDGENQGGYLTWDSYSLVNSSVFVEVVQTPTEESEDHHATFAIEYGNLSYYIHKFGTNIGASSYNNGTTVLLDQTTYNPITQRWWRIRESEGTIYFDFSTNGTNWINFTSTIEFFVPSEVRVNIKGVNLSALEDPGTVIFDNVNMVDSTSTSTSTSSSTSTSTSTSSTTTEPLYGTKGEIVFDEQDIVILNENMQGDVFWI